MTPPHEKLPSKSPALLGLKFIQESRRSIKHLNAKIKLHVKQRYMISRGSRGQQDVFTEQSI